MNIHKNASLTPKGRAHLMREIQRVGLKPACVAAGLSPRTARKWQRRFCQHGPTGLIDRSSRPLTMPQRTCVQKIERALGLRKNQRLSFERIAERLGLSRSVVARACKAAGLGKLPPVEGTPPVVRYERQTPGELLHLDMKKLPRFKQPGHRVTADRTKKTPRAGYEVLHVAIDDRSRVGFCQLLTDEKAHSACSHLLAALRYYRALDVRIWGVMTDNGSAYRSKRFTKLLRRLKIKHQRTRPYTPRTNGKAERFIQTLLREWAYAYVYPGSDVRASELQPWMIHYNFRRPHSATEHRPPASRLGFAGNNVVRNYN
ncbi:IS481 family transposase [Hydrogenophaga sp. PAMC20947]|uniref:IS481 family transposase n=1 Tax=Hydrogenophaga sp. PAMC20947 TaxID=2565558 RepID=UPI00109E08B7|nr:IS481 family transposase [Hydrogenophaga sp. PAMC20947]QCB44663.1 IS481 family transposase [Hydrogenophaga sp. PAMC20947]